MKTAEDYKYEELHREMQDAREERQRYLEKQPKLSPETDPYGILALGGDPHDHESARYISAASGGFSSGYTVVLPSEPEPDPTLESWKSKISQGLIKELLDNLKVELRPRSPDDWVKQGIEAGFTYAQLGKAVVAAARSEDGKKPVS